MGRVTVAVIGGSGFYKMPGLAGVEEVAVETPFGPPSDVVVRGTLAGAVMLFLPRHGRGHRLTPSAIDYRANIWALKKLGAEAILSVSACGSMKEEIGVGTIVLVDQFFDRTLHRVDSFFGEGIAAHVAFADPVCADLGDLLEESAGRLGLPVRRGGTYVCIEGPAFSTRAESRIYRQWGVDVVGMTNLPEAKLAREAEICYATIAIPTDYDCWRDAKADVDVSSILEVLSRNVQAARDLIGDTAPRVRSPRTCRCASALDEAILTDPKAVPAGARDRLGPVLARALARRDRGAA